MSISRSGPLLTTLLGLPLALAAAGGVKIESCIPARWTGGPLELAERARIGTPPADSAAREAIAGWYGLATLDLLDGSPIHCLLVTFGGTAPPETVREQRRLVKPYTLAAHGRGLSVLGLVHAGAATSDLAAAAADAHLDGLVLDGDFPEILANGIPVIRVARDAQLASAANGPVVAIEGVAPVSRNLADMGMRSAPSAEPWIQSNIWLVRMLRGSRPIWISQQPDSSAAGEYQRSVADAALAGGQWIVALDDRLRTGLYRNDPEALAAWRRIGGVLQFAQQHAEWRTFEPYGNLAIIADRQSEEYLNLAARRQIPYRIIPRAEISALRLADFQAVVAADLPSPSARERQVLSAFAKKGGVVIAGPSWGNPPAGTPYSEVPAGKGRMVIYRDDDPEAIARDLRDLLSPEQIGVKAYNVPAVITYASMADSGKRLLVQLLNYSKWPADSITIRVAGSYRSARLFMPDAVPQDLELTCDGGMAEISIAKLPLWAGLLLESGKE